MLEIFFFIGTLHMNYFSPLLKKDVQMELCPFDVHKYKSTFYH